MIELLILLLFCPSALDEPIVDRSDRHDSREADAVPIRVGRFPSGFG